MNCSLPLKLCEHICHNYTAFYGPTLDLIVLKQREHIPAIFHCQTTNQLLNHLDKDKHKKRCHFHPNLQDMLSFHYSVQRRDFKMMSDYANKFDNISFSSSHLSSCGVWVDGYLARPSSMAVHNSCHFLSVQQGSNLLLRGHILPGLCLFQGLTNEVGILLNLSARIALSNPERLFTERDQNRSICQMTFEMEI